MISLSDYRKSKDIKGLVQKMFESRHVAHVLHLKSKSYSEHKALDDFYEGILDLADNFVETYQGQYGLLGEIPLETGSVSDAATYLEDCAKLFKVGRDELKDTHLQNIMDEVLSLTYKTIYKLKFLK